MRWKHVRHFVFPLTSILRFIAFILKVRVRMI